MLAKPEPRRIGPKTSIIGNIWCFYKSYDTSQQDHWNSYVAQEGCTNRRTDQSLENLCLQYFSSLNPCFLELASSLATPNLLWFRFVWSLKLFHDNSPQYHLNSNGISPSKQKGILPRSLQADKTAEYPKKKNKTKSDKTDMPIP